MLLPEYSSMVTDIGMVATTARSALAMLELILCCPHMRLSSAANSLAKCQARDKHLNKATRMLRHMSTMLNLLRPWTKMSSAKWFCDLDDALKKLSPR